MDRPHHSPHHGENTAVNLHLISDFNLETFGNSLANDDSPPRVAITSAPFGQVFPALLQPHSDPSDFALVWTSPGKVIPAFEAALQYGEVQEDRLTSELNEFVHCLQQAQNHFRALFVVSWTLPAYQRGNGLLSMRKHGPRRLLLQLNLMLAEQMENCPSIYLLDAQRWLDAGGKKSYNPKLWYLTKSPFQPQVYSAAARDLKAAISSVLGSSRKLLVVDLDNTLWGGVVGDLGWENLRLGGHDYLGEAFLDFQRTIRTLRNRGILLAIASKNEESVALEALTKHPEMVLRPEDFAARRINWNDKAANIAELAEELDLGLQSVVFIDDSPLERARVREALPEVYVPEWPDDKTLFASTLGEMECFDSAYATTEDASRHAMYATEAQRKRARAGVSSAEEWLLSSRTVVKVEEFCDANRERVVQLLNKTNQMNLTTRRLSGQELQNWVQPGNRKLWAFRVSDRFGDSGLTGIVSLEIQQGVAHIVDFVLSCRVMGRNVERVMVACAAQHSAALGLEELRAQYLPTAKNRPCLGFWTSSGFAHEERENRFTWSLRQPYPFPRGIEVGGWVTGAGSSEHSPMPEPLDPRDPSLPSLTS
jgi:FkbH-like protein